MQMQQGHIQLLQGLLDKMTAGQTESVGITDPAFAALMQSSSHVSSAITATSHIKSHADLKHAVAILLLAAEALPETDVQFSVCRQLFNQARHGAVAYPKHVQSGARVRAQQAKSRSTSAA